MHQVRHIRLFCVRFICFERRVFGFYYSIQRPILCISIDSRCSSIRNRQKHFGHHIQKHASARRRLRRISFHDNRNNRMRWWIFSVMLLQSDAFNFISIIFATNVNECQPPAGFRVLRNQSMAQMRLQQRLSREKKSRLFYLLIDWERLFLNEKISLSILHYPFAIR